MKTKTTEASIRPFAIGLAFVAMAASGQVAAYDIDYEIASAYDTAIEKSSSTTAQRSPFAGYNIMIVLDESYHDYQVREVIDYETDISGLEKTEIAVFEPTQMSIVSHNIPWELQVVD